MSSLIKASLEQKVLKLFYGFVFHGTLLDVVCCKDEILSGGEPAAAPRDVRLDTTCFIQLFWCLLFPFLYL